MTRKRARHLQCLALLSLILPAAQAAASATFYRDVLPILQKRCQGCHRPGEIGTGSFLTYESTRPWAKAIRAAVLTRKMPPWFADPGYGHFQNDRRLAGDEINTLVSWVDGGSAEGDAKDRPAAVKWTDGWSIHPDLVLEASKLYLVPATGALEYIYVPLPTRFTEDTWISAGEIRPSDGSVVHHITALVRPPKLRYMNDVRLESNAEFLLGYTPGMPAQDFRSDYAGKVIPAGSDIVLEVHFTPNGKTPVEETLKVGLVLTKVTPARQFLTISDYTKAVRIPPGDPNFEGHSGMTFNQAVHLVFLQPHMHLRGKDMSVRVVYPNGKSETVLVVPHFDFNWQIVYTEQKPLALPKGTRIEITGHWDNSANNPSNPDPTATVTFGPQSSDEMLVCQTGVTIDWHAGSKNIVSIDGLINPMGAFAFGPAAP